MADDRPGRALIPCRLLRRLLQRKGARLSVEAGCSRLQLDRAVVSSLKDLLLTNRRCNRWLRRDPRDVRGCSMEGRGGASASSWPSSPGAESEP
jgi:hypothetical protein